MKRSSTLLALTTAALTLACAADPGTRPQDMSAAAHEATAAHEDQSAQNHQSQHDPDARTESTRCAGKGGCWTSSRNPTAQHAEDAKQHRELSQKHRAAAAALIEAEARACAGIAEEDRDTSPFYHREDVESVSKLTEDVRFSKSTTRRDVGRYRGVSRHSGHDRGVAPAVSGLPRRSGRGGRARHAGDELLPACAQGHHGQGHLHWYGICGQRLVGRPKDHP
jgi:hypothetical protein